METYVHGNYTIAFQNVIILLEILQKSGASSQQIDLPTVLLAYLVLSLEEAQKVGHSHAP